MKRSEKYPQLLDEAWLREQYETLGKSCPQIAAELGCTSHLVAHRANQYGIQLRGRHGGKWRTKQCERCGTEFTPSGPAAKFCSKECRLGTGECEQCGKEFALTAPQKWQDKSGGWRAYPRKFCSFECKLDWQSKHSKYHDVNDEGYVEIKVEPTWHRDENGGYVRINVGQRRYGRGRMKEHRWVMEQRLGRDLLPHEEVHHRNGHKDDNDRCPACPVATPPPEVQGDRLYCAACGWESTRPPNLELWTTSQPRGQRVDDKIAWAVSFLTEYGYTVTAPKRLARQKTAPTAAGGDMTILF